MDIIYVAIGLVIVVYGCYKIAPVCKKWFLSGKMDGFWERCWCKAKGVVSAILFPVIILIIFNVLTFALAKDWYEVIFSGGAGYIVAMEFAVLMLIFALIVGEDEMKKHRVGWVAWTAIAFIAVGLVYPRVHQIPNNETRDTPPLQQVAKQERVETHTLVLMAEPGKLTRFDLPPESSGYAIRCTAPMIVFTNVGKFQCSPATEKDKWPHGVDWMKFHPADNETGEVIIKTTYL